MFIYLNTKPPSTPTPWDTVLEATYYQSKCIQYNIATENVEGEEDCLYLNVFTPMVRKSSLKLNFKFKKRYGKFKDPFEDE